MSTVEVSLWWGFFLLELAFSKVSFDSSNKKQESKNNGENGEDNHDDAEIVN